MTSYVLHAEQRFSERLAASDMIGIKIMLRFKVPSKIKLLEATNKTLKSC